MNAERLNQAKEIFSQMMAIRSKKRDWYLFNQFKRIKKIKAMIIDNVGGSNSSAATRS